MREQGSYQTDASRRLDEKIYSLSMQGLGRAEIAQTLDLHVEAVSLRLHRLGVKNQIPWATKEAILDRHNQGWRPSRIARQVGVIQPVVERVIEKATMRRSA